MADSPEQLVRRYFDAVTARDVDAMADCWADGGVEHIAPMGEFRTPEGIHEVFGEVFAAFPDGRLEVISMTPAEDRVAVHWRLKGTFAGSTFQGMEPNGARIELTGLDLLRVENGEIVRNDAYFDGQALARQLGLAPAQESPPERAMKAAFNARTKVGHSLFGPRMESVADGVWVVRGGFPKRTMNVYVIEGEQGAVLFDAGIAAMARPLAAIGARFGGIERIVLGHSHADHRGAAAALGAPVVCHPAEAEDARGDGGMHYFDFSKIRIGLVRRAFPYMLEHWDGGPVEVAGTIEEGDSVAGFEVVHLPGHAPGQIGLWRESDRLALSSDCFYTLDPETGRFGAPRLPHPAFTPEVEQARESLRKLAALEPSAAWPGHANPVRDEVRASLERAASAP